MPEQSKDLPLSPRSVFTQYSSDSKLKLNLIICIFLWTGTTFCQYLASYTLKNLPGDFYKNLYASTASEVVAIICSGIISNKIGFKNTLIFGYALAFTSGWCVASSSGESEYLYAFFVLLSRFGICITFNMNYVAN